MPFAPSASKSKRNSSAAEAVVRKSPREQQRKLYLTEDEVDLIDALRSAGQRGKPIEKIIAKYGYKLED